MPKREISESPNPRTERAYDALLEAIMKLASEKPVGQITITEVTKEAGVSRPVLYNYFDDVPTLVAVEAGRFMDEVFQEIDDASLDPEDPAYLDDLMGMFVSRVYERRIFCRNAMRGPSSYEITASVVRLLSSRMETRLIGKRLGSLGEEKVDSLHAISAGVIWLLTEWLDSDFEGENEPSRMAGRFADVMRRLTSPQS